MIDYGLQTDNIFVYPLLSKGHAYYVHASENTLKAGFHWRRSRSRSRSRRSASDPKSRIGVERRVVNWTESEEEERFHLLPIPLVTLTLNLSQSKLDWRSRKQKCRNQPITLQVLRPSDGLRLR